MSRIIGQAESIRRGRTTQRWLAALCMSLAPLWGCAQEVEIVENKRAVEVAPEWAVGQRWRVEYERTVPSPAMSAHATPPPPQRSVWRYEVLSLGDSANPLVHIAIDEEGGDARYEAVYGRGGLTLHAAFGVEAQNRVRVCEPVPDKPFFGWTQSQGVIFDWPSFEALRAGSPLQFVNADDLAVEQTAEPGPDGGTRVVLTQKDEDAGETVRSSQTWEPGALWWQSASVEIEFQETAGTSSLVYIRGKLLQ